MSMPTPLSSTVAEQKPRVRASRASIEAAFAHCERIARVHYENFPVASLFIGRAYRPHIASIYAFARTADDFADESTMEPEVRLRRLDEWEEKLDRCFEGDADDPVFIALAETVRRCALPKKALADLLTAFRMDVVTNRYETFEALLGYCRYSANPVGRLVLAVFHDASDRTGELADKICTALQLTNFWQDVSLDVARGRLYIPLEDLDRFGYTEQDLGRRVVNDRFRNLMRFEVERTARMFEEGRPLLAGIVKDLRYELTLTWLGGRAVLKKIDAAGYDVLAARPAISTAGKAVILLRALFRRDS
jgi:squalene synthase HpnC